MASTVSARTVLFACVVSLLLCLFIFELTAPIFSSVHAAAQLARLSQPTVPPEPSPTVTQGNDEGKNTSSPPNAAISVNEWVQWATNAWLTSHGSEKEQLGGSGLVFRHVYSTPPPRQDQQSTGGVRKMSQHYHQGDHHAFKHVYTGGSASLVTSRPERPASRAIPTQDETSFKVLFPPKHQQVLPEIKLRDEDMRSFAYHVMYSDRFKFLFITIPKVSCTEFIRLFFRLQGDRQWHLEPHFRKNKPQFNKLSVENATRIINDPSWTKAVFFRDPLERLLSAYLDKFVQHGSYSSRVFGSRTKLTFSEFVDRVTACSGDHECSAGGKGLREEGLHRRTNPHWKMQIQMCSLERILPYMTFVGSFSHLHDHTRSLLEQMDLWERYGSNGWGPRRSAEMFAINSAKHKTGSDHKLAQFYTPELKARVVHAYRADYRMMELIGLLRVTIREAANASTSLSHLPPAIAGLANVQFDVAESPVNGEAWLPYSIEHLLSTPWGFGN